MQKNFHPITPQKRSFSLLAPHEENFFKELSPMFLTVSSSNYGSKVKLEMLTSPVPTSKDLFSQLLASEHKLNNEDYFKNYQILEEASYQNLDDIQLRDDYSDQESEEGDISDEFQEDNGIRKRKRKSTAQLRILKNEFENVPNWGKQKIVEMSQTTGLSQSQVYKWWWDQKKKIAKYEKEHQGKLMGKKKLIKKDFSKRPQYQSGEDSLDSEQSGEEMILTKEKDATRFEDHPQTEKKVNKRLTF